MQMIHLTTRAKQALLVVIFVMAVALTFFATKAWGVEATPPPPVAKISAEPYDNYVRARPATTTTTTTTVPKRHEIAAPKTSAPAITVPSTGDVWERLRDCESHGNYAINTGNGYYGAYQFSAGTWNSMSTGYAFAHEAPPEVQDDAARRLQARSGWGQWPVCSRNAGAR